MIHKGTKILKTNRLTLRPFKEEDYEEVYENYGSDKEVHKYISWIPCDSLDKSKEFIKFNVSQYSENPKHYSRAVIYEYMIVGSVGLFNVEDNDSAELGYSLGSNWWNKGIITEAVRAVLNYAFKEVGFHRIYASCHEENVGSKRVMEKIGMSFEGKLRDGQKNIDGSYSNLELYSILENEFKGTKNSN